MEVFKFAASTLDTGIDEISQNSALWISGQKEPSKQAMMWLFWVSLGKRG